MRPNESYEAQGAQDYMDDISRQDCPYPARFIKSVEWELGWLKARLKDPLADDVEEMEAESVRDDLENDRYALMSDLRHRHAQAQGMVPEASALAAIYAPFEDWAGNCMGTAMALAESGLLDPMSETHGRYQVVYGGYIGTIRPGTLFSSRGPITHHAWIEFESGLVVDPTRWVFYDLEPTISATSIADYDLAAIMSSRRIRNDAPPAREAVNPQVPVEGMSPSLKKAVHRLLGRVSGVMDDGKADYVQMLWLGRRTLGELGEHAEPLYAWFAANGLNAVVPADNRVYLQNVLTWEREAAPQPAIGR